MPLPIDIPAVLKEATDIESALKTPLSVAVYVDETAPGDVVGHVRSVFASAGSRTRVIISYLSSEPLPTHEKHDVAVIIAGTSEYVGGHAAALRASGTPVMVATTMPKLVRELATAFGSPIPFGDLVSPIDEVELVARTEADAAEAPMEPYALDDEARAALDRRMGEWIIAVCREKRLAFALAFPFVRKPLSIDAVNSTALQNAGVGAVMFIPGADMPIMTLNQAKMLLQIAAAYGQPMNTERVKELAAVVGGAFLMRSVARQAVALVPVLGWAIKAGVGYAGTVAMGRAAIEYFEGGGDIVGLASVVQKARDGAIAAAEKASESPTGHKIVTGLRDGAEAIRARFDTRA